MSRKVMLVAVSYAHNNYLSSHYDVLSDVGEVQNVVLDEDRLIRRFFRRRSILTLPFEVLYVFFRVIFFKPSTVISVGPKSGFLCSIACVALPFVHHAHWFTGQVWAKQESYKASISYWSDWIISRVSGVLFCDGMSQRGFLRSALNLDKEIYVPKYGSVNGVSDKYFLSRKEEARFFVDRLSVCFVGRLSFDKGLDLISDLAKHLYDEGLSVDFNIYGPLDEFDKAKFNVWRDFEVNGIKNINVHIGYVDPVDVFSCSDVMILPSLREGFGSVVVEAQAMGLPVICSDVYGLKDAFIDGVTGIACNNNDLSSYVNAIKALMSPGSLKSYSSHACGFSDRYRLLSFKRDLRKCYMDAGVF